MIEKVMTSSIKETIDWREYEATIKYNPILWSYSLHLEMNDTFNNESYDDIKLIVTEIFNKLRIKNITVVDSAGKAVQVQE